MEEQMGALNTMLIKNKNKRNKRKMSNRARISKRNEKSKKW